MVVVCLPICYLDEDATATGMLDADGVLVMLRDLLVYV